MHTQHSKVSCGENSCGSPAIISFAQQDLCLEHFVTHCYRRLDGLERVVRSPLLEPPRVPKVRALLEECSSQMLLICFRHASLTNVDRSRLLDIVLQCGELQFMLRNQAFPKQANPPQPLPASMRLPRELSNRGRALRVAKTER
jgi:hypothetical protein